MVRVTQEFIQRLSVEVEPGAQGALRDAAKLIAAFHADVTRSELAQIKVRENAREAELKAEARRRAERERAERTERDYNLRQMIKEKDEAAKAAKQSADAQIKARKEVAAAIETNRQLARTAALESAEGFVKAGEGALKAARGIARATAGNEQDLKRMLETIDRFEAAFDVIGGAVDVWSGLSKGVRAYMTAIEAARGAQIGLTAATRAGALTSMIGPPGLALGAGALTIGALIALSGKGKPKRDVDDQTDQELRDRLQFLEEEREQALNMPSGRPKHHRLMNVRVQDKERHQLKKEVDKRDADRFDAAADLRAAERSRRDVRRDGRIAQEVDSFGLEGAEREFEIQTRRAQALRSEMKGARQSADKLQEKGQNSENKLLTLAEERDMREEIQRKSEMLVHAEQSRLEAQRQMLAAQRATTAELRSQLEAAKESLAVAKAQRESGSIAFANLDAGVRDRAREAELLRQSGGRLCGARAQEILSNQSAFEGTDLLDAARRRANEEGVQLGSDFFERSREGQAIEQIGRFEKDLTASTEREREISNSVNELQSQVERVVDAHWRRIIAMLQRVLEIRDERAAEEVVTQRNRDNSASSFE